jgi:hypothetical protein
MAEITIGARLEGVEDIEAGFNRIGAASEQTSERVTNSSSRMGGGYSHLMRTQAMVVTQSMSLVKTMELMAKGQIDVASGIVIMLPHMLRLTSSIWDVVTADHAKIAAQLASIAGNANEAASATYSAIAKGVHTAATWADIVATKAHSIAQAISMALSGPYGWAILAGAAAAAAVGVGLAMTIPSKQTGGLIESTGPYMLHAGEYVLPSERRAGTVNNYITIQDPVFRGKGDLDYLVGRLKRMGMA